MPIWLATCSVVSIIGWIIAKLVSRFARVLNLF
jgi:hypothetical protein